MLNARVTSQPVSMCTQDSLIPLRACAHFSKGALLPFKLWAYIWRDDTPGCMALPAEFHARLQAALPSCRHYLAQLNFYRQRVWICGVSGRNGLTYEEALTSEFVSGDGESPEQVRLTALD